MAIGIGLVTCLSLAATQGAECTTPPKVRLGKTMTVSGPLALEVVQQTLRQRFGGCRYCYEHALERSPQLTGSVKARFIIERDGTVSSLVDAGSTLRDREMVECVLGIVRETAFPQPESGTVSVFAPVEFSVKRPRPTR